MTYLGNRLPRLNGNNLQAVSMSDRSTKGLQPVVFYLCLFIVAGAGIYFRLDQFFLQVLLDDEWHAVHQLLRAGPGQLFLTIGQADFSIPLALLYWLEKQWFGLSELAMRWPMMVAGIATLFVLPVYLRRYLDARTLLVFAVLLAISPVLILYSRMARPYALTLLLAFIALAAFQRFFMAEKQAWKPALVYWFCTVACIWLHLVSLPLVLAPFLILGLSALFARDWRKVAHISWLGLATLAGLLCLVLPPVLAHPEALTIKLGSALPTLHTYYGVLFVWLGTSSSIVVLTGGVLAALGIGKLWRELPLIRTLLAGLVLTYLAVLLTEPAWVHHPQTFARYLLPALVLFLLAAARGVIFLSGILEQRYAGRENHVFAVLAVLFMVLVAWYSPLPKVLANPNSNTLHSVFRFDFRESENPIIRYQKDFPLSLFWQRLASLPPDAVRIAAAPFSFETNHWDAVRWEQISRQRVMPGFLSGLCVDWRWGEVPPGEGFSFSNAAYLADRQDLLGRGFDYVVYQKPFTVQTYQGERSFGADTAVCEGMLREQYPAPVFEDEWLVVFPVAEGAAPLPFFEPETASAKAMAGG
jgi:hypothetical protein